MKIKITLTILLLVSALYSYSQRAIVSIDNKDVTVSSYTDMEVIMSGKSNLHLTATTKQLNNSTIDLTSENSWVFFDNIRPTTVVDSLLQYITVNSKAAVQKSNVRVSIYKHGAVVIPQSPTFQPLKVYTEQNFTGDSTSYSMFTYNSSLGTTFDNKIRSFKLKRGYMATLASAADGTGYSRVFIADDKDLEFSIMPALLDKSISFIRVFDWEWVSKKGWCGTSSTASGLINSTWCYDWSAYASTNTFSEYVPMRAKLNWAPFTQISGLQYVTHALGLNEPDHAEQHVDDNNSTVVTVSQALAQWPDLLKSGLRLGAPATTSFSWLYQFVDSCNARNYRVDYVAVHAYWGAKPALNWYNDLKYVSQRTGRPVWITEWNNGANWTTETWPSSASLITDANATKQLNDMKAILNVMDTSSFIERYSIYNWVQDARAMVLTIDSSFMARNTGYASYAWLKTAKVIQTKSGKLLNGTTGNVNVVLTPAGQYYFDNKSAKAFNRIKEVIPTFTFSNPSLTIAFGTKKLTLNVVDPNAECLNGFILEKKIDNGSYTEFYRSVNSNVKQCSDTIDINLASKIRYRVRSVLIDGTITNYSNEVGFDVSNGGDIQYGTLSFSNVGWNPVFFKKAFSSTNIPAIILGAPTNSNSSVLLSPRAKLISATSRFNLQLAPWTYQNVSALTKEETVPYIILGAGSYDFGGLKAKAGKATVLSAWSPVTFAAAFDTIPVVFVTQLSPSITDATTVRVRNVTKTGFEARIQKETKVTLTPSTESVSYFAITPGKGMLDGKKIIVGKTANTAISPTTYSSIFYGDSIPNPIFLTQMQTCNDDTVTATMRCLTIGSKFANVTKQREKSTGATYALTEGAGWMVINPVSIIQAVNNPFVAEFKFYPNPVKDILYFSQDNTPNMKADIYNMVGVLVKSTVINENKIEVIDLLPGYYILKTANHGSKTFMKI